MRVTKKVENYIREQVKAKVMPKYEAEKAEAIAWVENEASPIIEIAASKGEFRASIHTKKFSERQMIEICNYFRKHGYTAVRSDAETLKVSW